MRAFVNQKTRRSFYVNVAKGMIPIAKRYERWLFDFTSNFIKTGDRKWTTQNTFRFTFNRIVQLDFIGRSYLFELETRRET